MPGPLAALLRLAGDDGEGAAGNAPRGTEAAAQGPPTSPLADAAASLARERAMRLQAEAGCADACMLLEDAQAALSGAVALKDERDRLHAQLRQGSRLIRLGDRACILEVARARNRGRRR